MAFEPQCSEKKIVEWATPNNTPTFCRPLYHLFMKKWSWFLIGFAPWKFNSLVWKTNEHHNSQYVNHLEWAI